MSNPLTPEEDPSGISWMVKFLSDGGSPNLFCARLSQTTDFKRFIFYRKPETLGQTTISLDNYNWCWFNTADIENKGGWRPALLHIGDKQSQTAKPITLKTGDAGSCGYSYNAQEKDVSEADGGSKVKFQGNDFQTFVQNVVTPMVNSNDPTLKCEIMVASDQTHVYLEKSGSKGSINPVMGTRGEVKVSQQNRVDNFQEVNQGIVSGGSKGSKIDTQQKIVSGGSKGSKVVSQNNSGGSKMSGLYVGNTGTNGDQLVQNPIQEEYLTENQGSYQVSGGSKGSKINIPTQQEIVSGGSKGSKIDTQQKIVSGGSKGSKVVSQNNSGGSKMSGLYVGNTGTNGDQLVQNPIQEEYLTENQGSYQVSGGSKNDVGAIVSNGDQGKKQSRTISGGSQQDLNLNKGPTQQSRTDAVRFGGVGQSVPDIQLKPSGGSLSIGDVNVRQNKYSGSSPDTLMANQKSNGSSKQSVVYQGVEKYERRLSLNII